MKILHGLNILANACCLFLFATLVSCSDRREVSEPEPAIATSSLAVATSVAMVELTEQPETDDVAPAPSWDQYISRYTQGWVPAEQPIKIHFSHSIVGDEQLNIPFDGVISLSPDLAYQSFFSATDELTLVPEKRLPAGQVVAITLSPGKLDKIPDELGDFQFQVQALKQDYELSISGLVPGDDKKTMKLQGTIHTSDTEANDVIEKTLNVLQVDEILSVVWQHSNDRLNHDFTVKGIARGQQKSQIDIDYSAQALGVDKSGRHTLEIPALNQFTVTAARTVQRPKQLVEISFSEPLDRNQNLNGLVRLAGENARVRVDGSRLQVYPSGSLSGIATLEIEDTVRSTKGLQLPQQYKSEVTFISELPGVRFVGKGSIIPPTKTLSVPFEAINVNAVWVTAFKVYGNNMQQFIQGNQLQSTHVDARTGRYLWRKKITLPSVPFDQWQRYDIDLAELMSKHQDGLINLQLHIDNSTIAYPCPNDSEEVKQEKLKSYDGPQIEDIERRPDWFDQYYSASNGYVTREEKSNPCSAEFYSYYAATNISAKRYFLVSDIGLIVKKGSGNTVNVIATGIQSGQPERKTKIRLYNYQHQEIATAVTDKQGMATLESKGPGFYLIAEKDGDKGYIRLPRNEALPTSQFDVGGEKIRKGIKGFIYGERDVWRPGDEIYLTFVLQDKEHKIPSSHPVSLDFFDPRGSKILTAVNSNPIGELYTFTLKTDDSAPTGNWRAVVRVGGEYFDKTVKVETITPNRLKVDITPAQRPLHAHQSPVRTELFAQWLNGATAKNLKADTEMKLTPMKTTFDGWSQFEFDDPASEFKQFSQKVFEQKLDAKGRAAFNLDFKGIPQSPGKLRATFVTRVFEQSGNFSTSIRSEEVLPYENWVGVNIPKGDGYNDAISRDKDHPIDLIAIDSAGEPVAKRQLSVSIYHIGWRWWWDQSEENLANYIRGRNTNRLVDAQVTTDEHGRASWLLEKNKYQWGRHLVRVCDQASGHCSGKEVYLGWSWSNQVNPDSATQLMLGTDKKLYQPGDLAKISIPELAEGKLLYSVENGSRVLEQKWLDLKPGATSFELPVTEAMAPNVYVNVVLLLPHQQRTSDAPIRLYGITPLLVDNPQSHITPVLDAPDTVRPQSVFAVTVSEQNNKKMSYTLAVVDEGLLGITGYSAPDPHQTFYRREALGVLTWDMFDGVIGAYGANLERLLKIGGGDKGKDEKAGKQRRFPPVVKFLGAFSLAPGETKTHSVQLPQYMGAVRVMVVAADNGAYGKAEQSITVTQPLTLLATLPRVLGPNEKVALPINVFVNSEHIKEVDITVTANDLFELSDASTQLQFAQPGDQIAMLELQVKDRIGMGEVTVSARAGDEITTQTIHIESRSPNLASTKQVTKLLQPGETWQPDIRPHGLLGTNQSKVSVSRLPPLNLEKRMGYLIRYPHGCLEQTTSAIFPQIWLNKLTNLSAQQQDDIQVNVNAAINKYRNFQVASGGFSYWPGSQYINEWSNNYVIHFLVEAKAQGYPVPQAMLDDGIKYLGNVNHVQGRKTTYTHLVEAYRLYVLAIAGSPDLAAMNRLRESLLKLQAHYNDHVARWMLTLAYQALGLSDIAEELLENAKNIVEAADYREYTYGSTVRDSAVLLWAYQASGKHVEAWDKATEVAAFLSRDDWYSTHSIAWALLSLSKYAAIFDRGSSRFAISEHAQEKQASDFQWQALESVNVLYQHTIEPSLLQNAALMVRNDGDSPLHVAVTNTGIPSQGQEVASQKGLSMKVKFTDMEGKTLDISQLPQGQDFIAEVTTLVDDARASYKVEDIAMTIAVPSGWQIRNQRLEGDAIPDGLDYQDIRDDRVLSYFSLWHNYYWYYRYNDRNRDSQTVKVILNASFAGKFYLPGWQVKSMYDEEIHAQSEGMWVAVELDGQSGPPTK